LFALQAATRGKSKFLSHTKVRLANVLADAGNLDEARDIMIRAARDAVEPDALVDMGRTYRRLGLGNHAVAAFESALERNPADASALSALAELRGPKGKSPSTD